MKWRNHKMVTFAAVFSMTGGFIAAGSATIGSVLPDVLEMRGIIQHRTLTHYIWFWIPACALLWIILKEQGFSSVGLYCMFFLVSGGLLHICQDALSNGGVPYLSPYGPCIGLGVYRTNSVSEELTVLGLVLLFAAFSWYRGFLNSSYLSEQADTVTRIFLRVAHF